MAAAGDAPAQCHSLRRVSNARLSYARTVDVWALDSMADLDYIPSYPPRYRGRSHETQTRAGEDAAPAGGARNPAPGRPRVAVRPHYGGLPSMAGRGADEGGRKPAGSG